MSSAKSRDRLVRFSHAELVLLNNALNEILHGSEAIAPWEFQTRTGVSVEDATALLARIGKELEATDAH